MEDKRRCLRILLFVLVNNTLQAITDHDYCIIGAGPAGLQLGYYLQKAERDYIIFERSSFAGSFFAKYPRHRTLISINKRNTGSTNKEYNMRHDWNSLLSDNDDLLFRHYSKEMFPNADIMISLLVWQTLLIRRSSAVLPKSDWYTEETDNQDPPSSGEKFLENVIESTGNTSQCELQKIMQDILCLGPLLISPRSNLSNNDRMILTVWSEGTLLFLYLNDFAIYYKLKIQYDTGVSINVKSMGNSTERIFHLTDQHHNTTKCRIVIVATGLWVPNIPDMNGIHLSVGYENISTNPDVFEAKSVLILGRGNSAFETANSIYEKTNFVHMLGRQRIRLAWETHYVGDVRAVNNGLLDTYQLKSLDGLLEFDEITDYQIIQKNNKLYLRDQDASVEIWSNYDNDPLLMPYDYIIRCLGFKFDESVFKNGRHFSYGKGRLKKYPAISDDYQSKEVKDLFFAGTIAHSLDYRTSSGGFIHGFRYTVKSLHHILSWRYHNEKWPHIRLPTNQIVSSIIKRISETSGLYQMFAFLADILVFQNDNKEFAYFEEFPIKLLSKFENTTGVSISDKSILVVVLQYGDEYHGPMEDVFRVDRATTSPRWAHLSNFLHPVLYYYDKSLSDKPFDSVFTGQILPRPSKLHHMVEDFNTIWHHPDTHIQPLTTFLENCLKLDLKIYNNYQCLRHSMTNLNIPMSCLQYMHASSIL